MIDEVIFVDKPSNMTSFGAVARVRRMLSQKAGKKVKVGHTGTLDPFATGLLILLAGKATKRAAEYSKKDKVYEATIILGSKSTTGDPEGEIETIEAAPKLSRAEIEKALAQFIGHIKQRPPIYSAIKINGQRAYKLARKGETFTMPEREVEIYSIELLKWNSPELSIRCHVSSGTYIRTLAEDIAKALGTVAYTQALMRTQVGEYKLGDVKLFALDA